MEALWRWPGSAGTQPLRRILQRGYVLNRDFRAAFGDSNIELCLLIAPHGGGIEPGSSEIMRTVAEVGGWVPSMRSPAPHSDGTLYDVCRACSSDLEGQAEKSFSAERYRPDKTYYRQLPRVTAAAFLGDRLLAMFQEN